MGPENGDESFSNPRKNISGWKPVFLLTALLIGLATPIAGDYADSEKNISINSSEDLLFITTQGGPDTYSSALSRNGRLVVFNSSSKEVLIQHNSYDSYFDVDIVNKSTVLFVAHDVTKEGVVADAVYWNYREQKVLNNFTVPETVREVEETEKGLIYGDDKGLWLFNSSQNRSLINLSEGPKDFEVVNDTIIASVDDELVFIENRTNKSYSTNHSGRLAVGKEEIVIASDEGLAFYTVDDAKFLEMKDSSVSSPVDAERLEEDSFLVTGEEEKLHVQTEGNFSWSASIPYMPYDVDASDTTNISGEALSTDHYWSTADGEEANTVAVENAAYPAFFLGLLGIFFMFFKRRFL